MGRVRECWAVHILREDPAHCEIYDLAYHMKRILRHVIRQESTASVKCNTSVHELALVTGH